MWGALIGAAGSMFGGGGGGGGAAPAASPVNVTPTFGSVTYGPYHGDGEKGGASISTPALLIVGAAVLGLGLVAILRNKGGK